MFNFERLYILCAWIGHLSQKLWPFEFLESFHCSISSVSIYHGPNTYTRVKSYRRLNLPRVSVFILECLDILCAWIGHPSKKLRPFEFLESFRCSLSSVPIYHGLYSFTRVKSYGHLNFLRTFVFNFEGLIHYAPESNIRVKSYDHLNFSRAFIVHFRASRYIMGLTNTPELKVISVWISQSLWVQFWASWYIMLLNQTSE